MNLAEEQVIVVDNGSCFIKAGFAGDDAPRLIMPTMVGFPRSDVAPMGPKDHYVGDEAQMKRNMLDIKHPIERGVICDWDLMEKVWTHTFFNELSVDPTAHPFLLSQAPLNPIVNKEKTCEVLFEKFQVPALYLAIQGVLSVYAGGRGTGVVLDVGGGITHVVPVHNGFAVRNAITRLDLAGIDLDEYLARLLTEAVNPVAAEPDVVRHIKEHECFIAPDFEQAMRQERDRHSSRTIVLPDGRSIDVGAELFTAPEALFQPSLLGMESHGIAEIVEKSVMKCDEYIRSDLFGNVIVSGGSSKFPGLVTRLQSEITKLVPPRTRVTAFQSIGESSVSAWVGGSILGSFPTFPGMWVSNQQYSESGPLIVRSM